jgi:hypothetical protein
MGHPLTSTGECDLTMKDRLFRRYKTCEAGNPVIGSNIGYLCEISLFWAFYNGLLHHHSYKL